MAPHPWRPPQKKRRPNKDKDKDINPPPKEIPKFAYIQAYEANLVYNRVDEAERAQSFNRGDSGPYGPSGNGEGLIQWAGDGAEGDAREVWADRYDMIHLLSTIPDHLDGPQSSRARTARSPSPADSWPDAASDEEAIFNLSDEEDVVAYQREKRRKWVDALREERLKGLDKQEAEVQEEEEEDKDARGQADDDPTPPAIIALMQHTALAIARSPNPTQLESKILAHHAGDERFGFLRGRYPDAWIEAKRAARVELGLEKPPQAIVGVGMGLGGYESSDEEEEEDEEEQEQDPGSPLLPPCSPPPPPPPPDDGEEDKNSAVGLSVKETVPIHLSTTTTEEPKDETEEQVRAQRKARMEEWKRKRQQADQAKTTGA